MVCWAEAEKFAGPEIAPAYIELISQEQEMSFQIHTGIQPMWAWYSFWALLLLCIAILIWGGYNDRDKE